ncbi:MAG TPA: hypothetical protein IAB84_00350 [Candidatus Choladousia intestinigallinarum]|nr:hypothetical protein [Candidatus Choladousia intestinigallinarum]
MKEENSLVLCGANAYEEKFYLNEQFQKLPQVVKDELQIMCVLYTQDVGGIFLLEFDGRGNLHFRTEAAEDDFSYDEIGSVLKIKELQRTKEGLLRSLEMYYQLVFGAEAGKAAGERA